MMITIGITGGVGAGKSTVLDFLEEKYQAYVMKADEIGHLVMEPGQSCYEPVIALFGRQIIKNDKTIIISTHIVSDVKSICDEIVIINEGRNVVQGTCSDITSIGNEKVFLLDEEYENNLEGNYYVKDRISKDNKNYIIVLSSNFIEQGVSINADIEDGYLCALKNI